MNRNEDGTFVYLKPTPPQWQLHLPTANPAGPVKVVAAPDQVLHVYGEGLERTTLAPGQSMMFEQRQYPRPIAFLRMLCGLLPYRWVRGS